MLHGSETWPVGEENEVALQLAEMRMIRWMCNVKVKDRVRSKLWHYWLGARKSIRPVVTTAPCGSRGCKLPVTSSDDVLALFDSQSCLFLPPTKASSMNPTSSGRLCRTLRATDILSTPHSTRIDFLKCQAREWQHLQRLARHFLLHQRTARNRLITSM